jgi:HK97 family phage portal protein
MFGSTPEALAPMPGVPLERAFDPHYQKMADPTPVVNIAPQSFDVGSNGQGSLDIVRDAYVKIGAMYACLRLIANAIAEAPMIPYQRTPAEPKALPEHRVRDILSEPNPEQSEAEFWKSVVLIAGTCDYCILEHVRNGLGETIQLRPRSPEKWTRRTSQSRGDVWEVSDAASGRIRYVKPEDVTIIPYDVHPKLAGYGLGPIRVIGRELGIEDALVSFVQRFISRGGIIPYVLTQDGPIWSSTQVRKAQIEMQQYHGGNAIELPPVLSGGLKIQQTGSDLNGMAWLDLRGLNELRIAQAFNVQPHLIGALFAIQNGGLSTTELGEAMGFMQRYTAGPMRVQIAGAMTRSLMREYEPDKSYYLHFDCSEILSLQEERNKLHERARADLLATGITRGEFREQIGLDPLPDATNDVLVVPLNLMDMPLEPVDEPELAVPAITVPAAASAPPRWVRRPKAEEPVSVKAGRETMGRLAKRMEPKLRSFFKQQGKRIAKQVGAGWPEPEDVRRELVGSISPVVSDAPPKWKADPRVTAKLESAIDWADELNRLTQVMQPLLNLAATAAVDDVNDVLGSSVTWSLANPHVIQIWDQLGKRIVGISETTRLDVAKTVQIALDEGVGLRELEARLFGLFEETYSRRSMAIARTESQVAYNTASVFGYSETGQVDEVELWDNPDHPEDYGASDGLTCAQRDGLIVPIHQADRHINAEHPNGSLAVAPVVRPEG